MIHVKTTSQLLSYAIISQVHLIERQVRLLLQH